MTEQNVEQIYFIEDKYHRYAIVFEYHDGHLSTGSYGIEYPHVPDHVETMEEEYPGVTITVEDYSGEEPVDPEPIDEPYPKPRARRAR